MTVPNNFSIAANEADANINYPGPSQLEGTPSVPGDFGVGPAGTSSFFYFTITRSGPTDTIQSVNWSVTGSGGFPALPDEFIGGKYPSGLATFGIGSDKLTIRINVQPNYKPQGDQQFTVTLFNPTDGAGISTSTATSLIRNDDIPTDVGTTGNDKIDLSATTGPVFVDASQGGNDNITLGSGPGKIYFGSTFTNQDIVKGGSGVDTVILDGNYATTVSFGSKTMTGIENLYLSTGNSYNLTLHKATVANGETLNIDASALAAVNTATINASGVKGVINFLGGAGINVVSGGGGNDKLLGGSAADTLNGNAGDDILKGNFGADIMNGGAGKDIFVYDAHGVNSPLDSPLVVSGGVIDVSGADTLASFVAKDDKIDLSSFGFSGAALIVKTAANVGYSSTIGLGVGFFGVGPAAAGVLIEYEKKSSSSAARIYVDANHNGNLDLGDMVIQVTGVGKDKLTNSNFIF